MNKENKAYQDGLEDGTIMAYKDEDDKKALEARIIDLSAKLDQAIDMLDLNQRAFLLNKCGKGS